jgi:hypothetical protein
LESKSGAGALWVRSIAATCAATRRSPGIAATHSGGAAAIAVSAKGSTKAPLLRNVHFLREVFFELRVAAAQSVLENIGHRDEFNFAVVDLQSIFSSPGTAATASDQRYADLIVFS